MFIKMANTKADCNTNTTSGDNSWDCEQCNMTFKNWNTYCVHLRTVGHIQKSSSMTNVQSDKQEPTPNTAKPAAKPTDEEEDNYWTSCQSCNLTFKNEHGFLSHLRSIGHMQNTQALVNTVQKAVQDHQDKTHPTEKSSFRQFSYSEVRDIKSKEATAETEGVKSEDMDWSWCEACQCPFTQKTSYYLHIRGINHCQKVQELEKRKRDGAVKNGTTTEKSGEEVTWYRCELCDLGFTNKKSYHTHIRGDFHENRMRLSEGLSSNGAKTKDIGNADNDDGKSLSAKSFHCEICQVSCIGLRSYNSHLQGQKHQKKVNKLGIEGPARFKPPTVNCEEPPRLLIQPYIDECQEPLIGLDYLTEYQTRVPGDEPAYTCDLCEARMDPRQFIAHVTGIRHRRKFLKNHHPSQHAALCAAVEANGRKSGTDLAESQARAIELREGRTHVRLKVALSTNKKVDIMSDINAINLPIWEEIGSDWRPVRKVASEGRELLNYRQTGPWEQDCDAQMDYTPVRFPQGNRRGVKRGAYWSGGGDIQDTKRTGFSVADPYKDPHNNYAANDWNEGRSIEGFCVENQFLPNQNGRSPFNMNVCGPQQQGNSFHRNRCRMNQNLSMHNVNPYSQQMSESVTRVHDPWQVTNQQNTASAMYFQNQLQTVGLSNPNSSDGDTQPPPWLAPKQRSDGPWANKKKRDVSYQQMSQNIKSALEGCMINSEHDAEVALQVSNSLTKALTQYRIKTLVKQSRNNKAGGKNKGKKQ